MFLAHPGGPFWRDRDAGAWTIPKGIVDEGEELLDAACREFEEETGIRPAGRSCRWAACGRRPARWSMPGPGRATRTPARSSATCARVEWPPGSGRWITYPEVDRCAWFDPAAARGRMNPAQAELIGRLEPRWRSRAGGDRSPPEAAEPAWDRSAEASRDL